MDDYSFRIVTQEQLSCQYPRRLNDAVEFPILD